MPFEAVVHRVLAIPELLDIIFSSQDRQSNINNSLVCKQWTGIALDNIWREVDNLPHLFNLLAPLQKTAIHPTTFIFARTPTQADWAKFIPYARRVRRLDHTAKDGVKSIHLDQSVFDDIARTRTSLHILPNLNSLIWLVKAPSVQRYHTLFMHEKIRYFEARIHSTQEYSISTHLSDISGRMPSLTTLTLQCPLHVSAPDMSNLLRGFPRLKKITLPRRFLIPAIFEELAQLQELETIEFDSLGGASDYYGKERAPSFKIQVKEGYFPALWDLSLSMSLKDAQRFLVDGARLPKLTCLFVGSVQLEDPSAVHDFLSALVESYPNMEHLYLDIVIPRWDQPDTFPQITFDHFRPILGLTKLATFELRNNFPIPMSESDVLQLGTFLPCLETLQINPEPFKLDIPTLSISSLNKFAQHFPKLRKLGVYIDATIGYIPFAGDIHFPSLEVLNVGVSPIDGEEDTVIVALYLSRLFASREPALESGLTWNSDMLLDEAYEETVQEQCDVWEEVARMLPLLGALRQEERLKRSGIEKEVDDLKMRNEVLMGSMHNSMLIGQRERLGGSCVIG